MHKCLEVLVYEHRNILKIIDILKKHCTIIDYIGDVDKIFFNKIIEFIRIYADKLHHMKEEDILFEEAYKLLDKSDHGMITKYFGEHNLWRHFIKEMEEWVFIGDKVKIIKNAKGYWDLLKIHTYNEDAILFPYLDRIMSLSLKDDIWDKFIQVDKKMYKEKIKHLYFLKYYSTKTKHFLYDFKK